MIGEAGYETSEESSDFKDVREMRADKTQTWLSAGFGDDSPHEFVGTIMPASRAAEGKCAALHRFANAGGTLYSALYEDGQEILSCERSGEDDIRLPQPDSRSLTRREGRRRPLRVKS